MRHSLHLHCLAAVALLFAARSNAQESNAYFFVQLADTQFGFHTEDRDFAQETAEFEFVIANLNRLRPAFVVVCGDLVNKPGDPAQTAEYLRIAAKLDRSIPLYNVPGNHDIGNEPTPESLAVYRAKFGKDYYTFRHGDLMGIVLNSGLMKAPAKVTDEAATQEAWLKEQLAQARTGDVRHVLVFLHHPYFLQQPDEASQYFNIPTETRRAHLERFNSAGVRHVFAGHYHRIRVGKAGDLEMVTSGPVGKPLGDDPSGIRVVIVRPTGIEHRYFSLGAIPNQIQLTPAPRGSTPAH